MFNIVDRAIPSFALGLSDYAAAAKASEHEVSSDHLVREIGSLATFAAKPIISLEGVSKVYAARTTSPEVIALDHVSLAVPKGSIVGVIGRSGAGKSTLIRLVNGLEQPTQGRVVVDNVEVSALAERDLRLARQGIGMIFQHFNLLSSRTAFDNVALPLEIIGRSKREIEQAVAPLLEFVGLTDKRDRYPAELSGGQKQRIGIARALATRPKVLLSDEATSALDPETTAQILALIKRINTELDLTVLLITHEMSVVKTIADRVAVLEQGRIVEEGTTFDIFAKPRHPTTRSFVGSVTGATLPTWLANALRPERGAEGKAVVRIVFAGEHADEPVLSRIARLLATDLNILYGQIDAIADRPFGTLVISIDGDAVTLNAVRNACVTVGVQCEVLGYVS